MSIFYSILHDVRKGKFVAHTSKLATIAPFFLDKPLTTYNTWRIIMYVPRLIINPVAHVVLEVDLSKTLEQFATLDIVFAREVKLAINSGGDGAAKGFFEQIDLRSLVFITSHLK